MTSSAINRVRYKHGLRERKKKKKRPTRPPPSGRGRSIQRGFRPRSWPGAGLLCGVRDAHFYRQTDAFGQRGQFVHAEQVQAPLQQFGQARLRHSKALRGPSAVFPPTLDRPLDRQRKFRPQPHIRSLFRRVRQSVPDAGKSLNWFIAQPPVLLFTRRNLRAASSMPPRAVCWVFFWNACSTYMASRNVAR